MGFMDSIFFQFMKQISQLYVVPFKLKRQRKKMLALRGA